MKLGGSPPPEMPGGRLGLLLAVLWLALVFGSYIVLMLREAWPKLTRIFGS